MPRKLYVANLSHLVNEAELARLFAGYGIGTVKVFDQLATADPSAAGLVEVDTDEHGELAIAALNGKDYRGYPLSVSWAIPSHIGGSDTSRMFESMNIPEESEGRASGEPRGPRRGDFGDRSGGRA